jgi:hypothetical protein
MAITQGENHERHRNPRDPALLALATVHGAAAARAETVW